MRKVMARWWRPVAPPSHRAVGATGTSAAAADARTPAAHLKMPRMVVVLRRLLVSHRIDGWSGAHGCRAVMKMKRHLTWHGDRAVVVTLGSQGLLTTHGGKSLIVVGHTLGYRTGQMFVSENSGRMGSHRFLTVTSPANLVSGVNLVALWRLNGRERMK